MKYRELIPHQDVFQAGDILPYTNQAVPEHFIGELVLVMGYRRPISAWIDSSVQKPTKEDESPQDDSNGINNIPKGTVLVRWKEDNSMGYWSAEELEGDDDLYFWIPLAFEEETIKRIKVGDHEVIPQSDGSIKVGCQTVSKKDMQEIVRQWEATQ